MCIIQLTEQYTFDYNFNNMLCVYIIYKLTIIHLYEYTTVALIIVVKTLYPFCINNIYFTSSETAVVVKTFIYKLQTL